MIFLSINQMQIVLQKFFSQLDPGADLISNLVFTAISAGVIFALRFVILQMLRRRPQNRTGFNRWRTNSAYLAVIVLCFLLLPIWVASLRGILAVLGIFGAGILIVSKEPIQNIIAWFYLMIRRPFEAGNRISIDGLVGDVFEIRLLDFSMIEVQTNENGGQSTGRIMHIPNGLIFTKYVANASKEFSFNWNEIKVCITKDSDWRKAEKILLEIAHQVLEQVEHSDHRIQLSAAEYAIQYKRLTPVVYISFTSGQIVLTLRHLTEPRRTRILTDLIWREILTRFKTRKKIQLID